MDACVIARCSGSNCPVGHLSYVCWNGRNLGLGVGKDVVGTR